MIGLVNQEPIPLFLILPFCMLIHWSDTYQESTLWYDWQLDLIAIGFRCYNHIWITWMISSCDKVHCVKLPHQRLSWPLLKGNRGTCAPVPCALRWMPLTRKHVTGRTFCFYHPSLPTLHYSCSKWQKAFRFYFCPLQKNLISFVNKSLISYWISDFSGTSFTPKVLDLLRVKTV